MDSDQELAVYKADALPIEIHAREFLIVAQKIALFQLDYFSAGPIKPWREDIRFITSYWVWSLFWLDAI